MNEFVRVMMPEHVCVRVCVCVFVYVCVRASTHTYGYAHAQHACASPGLIFDRLLRVNPHRKSTRCRLQVDILG